MKIFLMTDLESVAGVVDSKNGCHPHSKYDDLSKELLTREPHAAGEGFFSGGATEILVAEGHRDGVWQPLYPWMRC